MARIAWNRSRPAAARHLFVQQHDAIGLALEKHQGVVAVGAGLHGKSLFLEEEDVGREALDLIVNPENALGAGHAVKIDINSERRTVNGHPPHRLTVYRSPFTQYLLPVPDTLRTPNILAVRFSSIGDILLTTPLLRAIRHRHPAPESPRSPSRLTSRCSATIPTWTG